MKNFFTIAGKANFHTHTLWCDGKNTPREMIEGAIARGFALLGFSSHVSGSDPSDTVCPFERIADYAAEIRSLEREYADKIIIKLGVEADYIPGIATPDVSEYAFIKPDYIIGSIHYVIADDGGRVPVDHTPELLAEGIARHFNGSAETFIKQYFKQERDMVSLFNFDVVGHPDLVRKFNLKKPYFDENAQWYRDEVVKTADAIANSGKISEINSGAISRGWRNDVYPDDFFRCELEKRGVFLIHSADAHSVNGLDFWQ